MNWQKIMAFKKVTQTSASQEPIGALLEVLPGQNEQALVAWLHDHGATEIEQLAPGFLSVNAPANMLRDAEAMARVEIKHAKIMHDS